MNERWTRQRILFLAISGLFVLLVFVWAGRVVLPFLVAAVLAYVLTPVVDWAEARGLARGVAVSAVCSLTLGVVAVSGAVGLPRLYEEVVELRQSLPQVGKQLAKSWGPWLEANGQLLLGPSDEVQLDERSMSQVSAEPLADGGYRVTMHAPIDVIQRNQKHWEIRPRERPEPFVFQRWIQDMVNGAADYVRDNTRELLRIGGAVVGSISRGIFLSFMTLMCAGYLMYTRDDIVKFFRSLPPQESRASFDRLTKRLDRGLSGVVRGQLLICLVNGALSGIGFALLGLKYWPLLTVVATVLSVIPIFGAILSTIPAVIIALSQDVWMALWVLLWIIAIHQVEANLLNPKIIGGAAKLHPVLVIFALVLGEHAYGLWGAVFAVPTLSVVQTLFLHFRAEWFAEPET